MDSQGKFIYSLDFELLWGVLDIDSVEQYKKNILGAWQALPEILNLFDTYGVHGTFATVGFLFAQDQNELIKYSPKIKPEYDDEKFSPYTSEISPFMLKNYDNKLYFANDLIDLIESKKHHEISTHTFSHYYCLESGPSIEAFKEDLRAAVAISKRKNLSVSSIIFPRNQYSKEHLEVLPEFGINSYRGNPISWCYNSNQVLGRILRLLDDYLNLTGNHCYSLNDIEKKLPYNLPASKFLRPYSNTFKFFNMLRLRRIKKSMTYAAKNNKIYHLWSHPHNFGNHIENNLKVLKEILIHYKYLNETYNFQSITMSNLGEKINANHQSHKLT